MQQFTSENLKPENLNGLTLVDFWLPGAARAAWPRPCSKRCPRNTRAA